MSTPVEILWSRLSVMEAERRFDGQAYPPGMSPFPFRLTGQGFFPGGDGLWRSETELHRPSSGLLPVGGAVFVGNDFGTLPSFRKLRSKGFENPLTWKHLKERIRRAGLPPSQMFFTNAIMGLRSSNGARALDKRIWANDPAFIDFCGKFFAYQMAVLRPRLVVILGPTTKSTLIAFDAPPTACFCTSHPYGDFNFSESRKSADAEALRTAWDIHIAPSNPT